MRKVERINIPCAVCKKSVERRITERQDFVYCSRVCQGARQNARLMVAKAKAARAKRIVHSQPEDHRLIGLGNGHFAQVDIADYDWLNQSMWHRNDSGYAIRDVGRPRRMHRAIMEHVLGRRLSPSEQVDHDDHVRLNNRRANFRLATNQQNGFNQKPRSGTSKFKGVFWTTQKQRWAANINLQTGGDRSKRIKFHLGFFTNETEAALAYDVAAIQLFGDYAYLNIIGR